MIVYTVGFTGKTAEQFFSLLKKSGVRRVIDVRLNNSSQLSGFAKKKDLAFFLKEICDIQYRHVPNLAPTEEILKMYKNGNMTWEQYEEKFNNILQSRHIEKVLDAELLDGDCFLCSEHSPKCCHRRLVAEYLKKHLSQPFEIVHLL
jgi:uncharacterized protein (DUF488 family)